ncbi:hypothetical protein BH11PLA1_BH11PLA1_12520 [soil metagenome]
MPLTRVDTGARISARPSEASLEALHAAKTLFDLNGLDLSGIVADRAGIAARNPHRDQMALIDSILWTSADFKTGVALWKVRADEFWVTGHFPGRPMLPGVLQVEAGAQLSVFLYNSRYERPKLCAFTHLDECTFRGSVQPGDDFFLLAQETKANDRRFQSKIQGIVGGKVAFEAQIEGLSLGEAKL